MGDVPHCERNQLHSAVIIDDVHEVRRLIQIECIDVDARDEVDETALHYAVYYGAERAGRELILHGADIDARNERNWTPLGLSVNAQPAQLVNMLIAHGADTSKIPGYFGGVSERVDRVNNQRVMSATGAVEEACKGCVYYDSNLLRFIFPRYVHRPAYLSKYMKKKKKAKITSE